jgi:hypothetical protein
MPSVNVSLRALHHNGLQTLAVRVRHFAPFQIGQLALNRKMEPSNMHDSRNLLLKAGSPLEGKCVARISRFLSGGHGHDNCPGGAPLRWVLYNRACS